MQIFIKIITGKTIALKVEATDFIETIKRKIYEKECIPQPLQRLNYSGKQLHDGRTLLEYKIKEYSTLHLVVKCKGEAHSYSLKL